jgi:hypothetical protein
MIILFIFYYYIIKNCIYNNTILQCNTTQHGKNIIIYGRLRPGTYMYISTLNRGHILIDGRQQHI